MDKRYQVFVSSTYDDLREERSEVMHALLELDCIPSGMELFPAADEDQWTLIKEVIDDCDYYVVIIGGRYGSVHSSGKSYTQMEYEYALAKGKPTIAFLHENPGDISSSKTESTDSGKQRLEEFRQLAQTKVVKYWPSAADLGSKVSRGVIRLIKDHPAIGWVRADEAAEVAAPEILRLRQRLDELQMQLEKGGHQPPEGSEQLAQGDEEFGLDFDVGFSEEDGDIVWTNVYWESESWNTIFQFIGPHMIDRASESEIKRALELGFKDKLAEIASTDKDLKAGGWGSVPELSSVSLKTDDLKTVILQLRALGLITRDDRKRSARDLGTYWTLTRLGDETITRLRAIRKGEWKRPEEELDTGAKVEGTSS